MTAQVLAFNRVAEPAPKPEKRKDHKVMPSRPTNAELRTREYLTSDEIDALMAAARNIGRHGHRDTTLILLGFRHGLRVAELIALHWSQIDLKQGHLHVRRVKNGTPATHPLRGPEIRALRRLRREYPDSPYVFVTERKAPLTASTVRHIVKRAGEKAALAFPVHPHMLRHYVATRTM
jgi:type 1 fimbriae regulatory protein FimB/type 1 fimbriae regulatory protein FimE